MSVTSTATKFAARARQLRAQRLRDRRFIRRWCSRDPINNVSLILTFYNIIIISIDCRSTSVSLDSTVASEFYSS